jgi:Lrp/AsnC family transcriptional regulator, regulator for asnA, asnC and gidA
VTNPLGLGFEAQAMIGIKTSGSPEPVADEIASWDEASYVVVAAGRFDLLVEVVCNDRRHLLELTTRLREVEGVVSTETFPYLSLAKQVYAWGTHLVEEEDA